MRAYQFRLSTVARIRALEERVAADRFRVSLRELRRAEQSERAAHGALAALESPSGVTSMSAVAWTGEQADRLSESLLARRDGVATAQVACDEAGRTWRAATKRSGVLERLDEQGRTRWRDELMRQESVELDDLSHARLGLIGTGQ
jgi:flagellar export protein FliJ